jgi:hypothetical protein
LAPFHSYFPAQNSPFERILDPHQTQNPPGSRRDGLK